MLKLTGAILLILGASLLGLSLAGRLTERTRALRAMIGALDLVERELTFHLASMPELLQRVATSAAYPADCFFRRCLTELDHLGEQSLEEIWIKALPELGQLDENAAAVLREVGGVLGKYDWENQRACLTAARVRLEECFHQAREEQRRMGRVYGTLGVTAGVFFAILLL